MTQPPPESESSPASRDSGRATRRGLLRTIGLGIGLFAGSGRVIAQGDATGQGAPSQPGQGTPEQPISYRGSASIQYTSKNDYGQPLPPTTHELPGLLTIGYPLSFGGTTESNPINLKFSTGQSAIARDPGAQPPPSTAPGTLFLFSALGTLTPETGREVLLQYWDLRYDQPSDSLVGELTNNNYEVGGLANAIFTEDTRFGLQSTVAFVNEGTTMVGRPTVNSAQVSIEGTASDGIATVPFSVTFDGQTSA